MTTAAPTGVLNDLWHLLPLVQDTALGLSGDESEAVQVRVDRVLVATVGLSMIDVAPQVAGPVAQVVANRATETGGDAIKTGDAVLAVVALCRIAGQEDRRAQHATVLKALTGQPVDPSWAPPSEPAEEPAETGPAQKPGRLRSGAAGVRAVRGTLKRAGAVAQLRPDAAKRWHGALAKIPIVGVAGEALGTQESLRVTLVRATDALALPAPSPLSTKELAGMGARMLKSAAVDQFLDLTRRSRVDDEEQPTAP